MACIQEIAKRDQGQRKYGKNALVVGDRLKRGNLFSR